MQDLEKLNRYNFRAFCEALAMPGKTTQILKAFDSYILASASLLLYSELSFINQTNEDFWLINPICNAKNESLEKADYIFTQDLNLELLQKIKKGNFKEPELSASIIYFYENTNETTYKLLGPGIKDFTLQKYPLDENFMQAFMKNNANFPLGNEIYFLNTSNGELKALSRTTKMEVV